MELIYESRSNFSNFQGSLHFVQHKPTIHQNFVVQPDTFVDGQGVLAYGTVLADSGCLRMWYQALPKDWRDGDIAAVAYAESDDGYHWRKKPLNLVKHGPGENHLCDLGLHSPSIFLDPTAPSSHRYRATGCGRPGMLARQDITTPGFYSAHSADGLHWELDASKPHWTGGDVITSIYHPQRKRGIVSVKQTPWVNRMRRRVIHTAQCIDGQYSSLSSALYPDEFDDVCAATRGHFTGDYYGMAMMPAGLGTVGFVWNFWHDLPYSHFYPYGVHGHSDITLTYQEKPGDRWLHVPGRPDFISRADLPLSSQMGWIYSSSTPVLVGDEHRLYFSSTNFEHFRNRDNQGQPVEKWDQWIREHGHTAMTFASWPCYRLFGFQTPRDASFDITLPMTDEPVKLYLNYVTTGTGSVRVSRAGDGRYTLASACPLTGDATRGHVQWKDESNLHPDAQGMITFTVHIERAIVYAYEACPVSGFKS